MARLVEKVNSSKIIKFSNYRRSRNYVDDDELQFIDKLIDNRIVNRLLAYDGYSPAMEKFFPVICFELSYSRQSNILKSVIVSSVPKSISAWKLFGCEGSMQPWLDVPSPVLLSC